GLTLAAFPGFQRDEGRDLQHRLHHGRGFPADIVDILGHGCSRYCGGHYGCSWCPVAAGPPGGSGFATRPANGPPESALRKHSPEDPAGSAPARTATDERDMVTRTPTFEITRETGAQSVLPVVDQHISTGSLRGRT